MSKTVFVVVAFLAMIPGTLFAGITESDSIDLKPEEEVRTSKLTGSLYTEIGYGSLFSIHGDIGVKFGSEVDVLRSLRLDIGITTLSILTIPSFIPITIRATFFGEDALEIGVGVLAVYSRSNPSDDFYTWSDNTFHPTITAGYRCEAYSGGLLFRANIGAYWDSGTGKTLPTIMIGLGHAFSD